MPELRPCPATADLAPILQESFNTRDSARLLSLWADDFHFEGPLSSFTGKERMAAQEQNLWTAFPDIQCEVEPFIVAHDRLVFATRMRGTHTGPLQLAGRVLEPSGRPIDFTLAVHMYMRNGLIAGERVFFDTAGFMRQLRLMNDSE